MTEPVDPKLPILNGDEARAVIVSLLRNPYRKERGVTDHEINTAIKWAADLKATLVVDISVLAELYNGMLDLEVRDGTVYMSAAKEPFDTGIYVEDILSLSRLTENW